MGSIDLYVTDVTGSRKESAQVPDDTPAIKVIAALVQAMKLPLVGPDGQALSYRFHHLESQSQLRDEKTLNDSGVVSGHTVRLIPEITAG